MVLRSRSGARRPGLALVLVVVSLVALLGVLALSLEGGLLLTERRNAQATADAAAQAAAADLYYNYYVNGGKDPAHTAYDAAVYAAKLNGYTNDGVNTKVTVNIPPQSGDYVGKDAYVEVVVEYYHVRGFSSLFGTDTVPVRARAVAVGKPSAAEVGILVLDPSAKSAFNANGGGNITVRRVPVVVNSTDLAGSIAGGGTLVSAPSFQLVGNYTTSGGGQFQGVMNTGVRPMDDPLKYLPVPDPDKMPVQSNKKVQYTNGTTTLSPGVYKGGINASSNANVVLQPGVYYMDAGGFQFTGQGTLTGNGVMIYTAPGNGNADGVSISAGGAVTLTPQTAGIYKGILLFQDRASNVQANISGGSNMNLTGTFYFAGAQLNVTGSAGFANFGSQYVSKDLNAQGTGSIYIDWDPDKVAQTRLIAIVE